MPTSEPLLKPDQLAELLGVKVSTLADWRHDKRGPEFIKLHNAVRYSRTAVDEWIQRVNHKGNRN